MKTTRLHSTVPPAPSKISCIGYAVGWSDIIHQLDFDLASTAGKMTLSIWPGNPQYDVHHDTQAKSPHPTFLITLFQDLLWFELIIF